MQKCTTLYRLRSQIMEFKPKGLKVLLSYVDLITLDWTLRIIHTCIVLTTALSALMWEADENVKKEKKETYINETIPFYLSRLDKVVKENGGFLANKKVMCS